MVFGGDFPEYQAQFTLNIPLRNRPAQADVARALLVQQQDQARLLQLQNTVAVDVQNSQIALRQARTAVEAAVKTRVLQEQALAAEQTRFQLGASTIFLVVQAQRDLSTAASAEVRAQVNLMEANASFERAMGRTLEANRIDIADAKATAVWTGVCADSGHQRERATDRPEPDCRTGSRRRGPAIRGGADDGIHAPIHRGECHHAWLSLGALLCIVLAGCGGQQAPASQARRYQLKGTVISIDRPEQRIVVDHEEIKGFMAAMAMPYPVSDPKLLDVAGPGDQITAEVVVTRHFGASGKHRRGQEGESRRRRPPMRRRPMRRRACEPGRHAHSAPSVRYEAVLLAP